MGVQSIFRSSILTIITKRGPKEKPANSDVASAGPTPMENTSIWQKDLNTANTRSTLNTATSNTRLRQETWPNQDSPLKSGFITGSTATTGKFAKTKSVTASFTWSITEGLTIGTENTFKAGIPGVVGGDLKFKTELSLSSTQGKTITETESFTVENHIPVAPKTSVKVVFTVIEREVEVPWTADVWVDGFIACWFDPKWDGHWLYFYPVWMLGNKDFKAVGNKLRYGAKGVFKGVRGVETVLTTEECDYDTYQNSGMCVSTFGLTPTKKVIERKIWHPSV